MLDLILAYGVISSHETSSVSSGLCLAAVGEKEALPWAFPTAKLECTAGRQQWGCSLALWAALLHPCAAKGQVQSSYISHQTGRGPSWGWYELGGSSCHDRPHVLETCCLPAETWCACLYPRQESTHAWWDARGAPGHHLCFRFANTHQWHSTGNLTTLSLMIFFTFVLKYSCGHTRSVQSKISSKQVLDTSNLQGSKCDTTA